VSNFKLAVAQVPSMRGDVATNINIHLKAIDKAAELGTSYLVFPELSLTGYEPELALALAFSKDDSRLAPLIESAVKNNISIAVGVPLRTEGLPNIGLVVISQAGIVDSYSKMNLHPGEELYFSKGDKHHCLSMNNLTITNAICADANQPKHVQHCVRLGADVYIAGVLITESGYKNDTAQMENYAKKFNILVAMANHAQPTGNWIPIGKSAIWSGKGLLASANETQSALVVAEKHESDWVAQVVEL